jgi:hypothetical protein
LKSIGTDTGAALKNDLLKGTSEEFLRQLLGRGLEKKKISGDLRPGESLNMDKAYSGEQEGIIKEKRQAVFISKMQENENSTLRIKENVLKNSLRELQEQLLSLAKSTGKLSAQTEVAAKSETINPGVSDLSYLQMLVSFLRSFTESINSAGMWMMAANKRAQKKDYWSRYKKSGSKFLLSGEHYLTRSAG